jgi:hypothetical protein
MNQRRVSFVILSLVFSLTFMVLGYFILAPESIAQGNSPARVVPLVADAGEWESLMPAHAPVVSRTVELEPLRIQSAKSITVEARTRRTIYPSSAMRAERYQTVHPLRQEVATEHAIRKADDPIPPVQPRNLGNGVARPAAVCVVNSSADNGPGTLRQCLGKAVPGDTITFNATVFPPSNPATISLLSTLPWIITNSLTIDASNVGVILNGSGLSSGDGLVILGASGVTVRGLQIAHFPRHGVAIANGARNTTIGGDRLIGSGPLGQGNLISGNGDAGVRIQNAGTMSNTVTGNYIGTNISGTSTLPNYYDGVDIIAEATNNTIGGTTLGARNLISGNGEAGVWIQSEGTMGNSLVGNYIGTNISGTSALPNYYTGVVIIGGAANNTIGGTAPGARNLISGNDDTGVRVEGVGTMSNTISSNYIGTTLSGDISLGNGSLGVFIGAGATNNTIGGIAPGARNLISGNGDAGIKIQDAGTMGNIVLGNYIGVNISGTVALPNYEGVVVLGGAANNIVGGDASGARNLISGNEDTGVWLQGAGTMSNAILNNYIGTDVYGTAALPNYQGIFIGWGATNNTIGGSTSGTHNLISGNRSLGVFIYRAGTMSNTVSGNYIGTAISGTSALGNGEEGVVIGSGATDNMIGGDTPGSRNLISGNGLGGVRLEVTGTMRNTVMGNYIGTDISGMVALPNKDGAFIGHGATNNVIGGTASGARNLISGNDGTGVWIQDAGTMSNTVSGNYIGTNISGSSALPNYDGVDIIGGATNNTVGGDTPGAGNIISGNKDFGVLIQDAGTMSNTILGNSIGTTISGTSALGNEEVGVLISFGATNNSIGGVVSGARNLISANGVAGVFIQNSGTMSNTILGNYVGTDISGMIALPNDDGVFIGLEATNNTIGGLVPSARNLISGNRADGVWIQDAGTMGNIILGNYIGTTISGDASLGNERSGVGIGFGAKNNIIGGLAPVARNLISGNGMDGVWIQDAGTMNNTIVGNYIGTNISGTSAVPNSYGVGIGYGATYNTIGGLAPEACNLISGNANAGIWIQNAGTMDNIVLGNIIGTTISGDASLGNERSGVFIGWGATQNTIGVSNTIAYNVLGGVTISGTTTLHNTVTRNVIRDNGGLPIDLVNWPIAVSPLTPILKGFSALDNTVWGNSCSGCRVEIFANPTITPAGTIFLGNAMADNNGQFSLVFTGAPPYSYLTATATDLGGTTSKFSTGFRLAGSRLTPASITTTVSSSATIAYVHTLMNVGPGTDTFTLTAFSDHGWPVTHQPPQVTLGSGVTTTVTATLTVPSGLTCYVADRLIINANSNLNAQAVAAAQDVTLFKSWCWVHLPLVIKK